MKSISLHMLMTISVSRLTSFLSTKINLISSCIIWRVCVSMCRTTSFVNQIESLRYITASISYNTGKYIFLCKKNNHTS